MPGNDGVNFQSRQLDMKLQKSEHFVSCTMVLDKGFWDLKIGNSDNTRTYISDIAQNGGFVSQKFTADDDGEVFWRIRVTCDNACKPEFKVSLDLEFNRTDINVLSLAYRMPDFKSQFRKKMPDENYCSVFLAPKKSASNFPAAILYVGFENIRFDISYAKVEKIDQDNISQLCVPQTTANKQMKSLASGVAALLKNPIGTDVTLRCNRVEWKLHKNILAASSKIFAAMFSHEMKENTEGVVDIEDADSRVLDLMIKFIYNAEIAETEMKESAEDLLIIAQRYDLPVLKETCEEKIIQQLRAENCLRVFLLGHKYNSLSLRNSAKRILSLNLSKICKTEEYKDFARENVDLSIEVTSQAFGYLGCD